MILIILVTSVVNVLLFLTIIIAAYCRFFSCVIVEFGEKRCKQIAQLEAALSAESAKLTWQIGVTEARENRIKQVEKKLKKEKAMNKTAQEKKVGLETRVRELEFEVAVKTTEEKRLKEANAALTSSNAEWERRMKVQQQRIEQIEESNKSSAKVMKEKCDHIKRLELQRMVRHGEFVNQKKLVDSLKLQLETLKEILSINGMASVQELKDWVIDRKMVEVSMTRARSAATAAPHITRDWRHSIREAWATLNCFT